jgi:hypothetical protein|tara:strand:- start:1311 stop:1433 length:123 start_codon:yes stop_codon:yes gene_type:complete
MIKRKILKAFVTTKKAVLGLLAIISVFAILVFILNQMNPV